MGLFQRCSIHKRLMYPKGDLKGICADGRCLPRNY